MVKNLIYKYLLIIFIIWGELAISSVPTVEKQINTYRILYKDIDFREKKFKTVFTPEIINVIKAGYAYAQTIKLDPPKKKLLDKVKKDLEKKNIRKKLTLFDLNLFNIYLAIIISNNKTLKKDNSIHFFDEHKNFVLEVSKKVPENLEELHKIIKEHLPRFDYILYRPLIVIYHPEGEIPLNLFIEMLLKDWPPFPLAAIPLESYLKERTPHGNILTSSLSFFLHDLGHARVYWQETENISKNDWKTLIQILKKQSYSKLDYLFIFLTFHETGSTSIKNIQHIIKKVNKDKEKRLINALKKEITKIFRKDADSLTYKSLIPFGENLFKELKKYLKKDYQINLKEVTEQNNILCLCVSIRSKIFDAPPLSLYIKI